MLALDVYGAMRASADDLSLSGFFEKEQHLYWLPDSNRLFKKKIQQLAQCHIETTSVTVAKCKGLALYTTSFALPLVHSRVIRSRGALPPPEVLAPNVL
jgi:hypothetical protein